MLGDRTEHPEPSETMLTPGASVRTRGSRGTLAAPLHWGALPWTPWPSGDDRRCRCHRPQLTSGFVSLCEIGARLGHVRLGAGAKSADKALRASQIFMVVKPFQSLRLQHDKVRNEFGAYCLVQHQVPRL
jgi:hypothetical protein